MNMQQSQFSLLTNALFYCMHIYIPFSFLCLVIHWHLTILIHDIGQQVPREQSKEENSQKGQKSGIEMFKYCCKQNSTKRLCMMRHRKHHQTTDACYIHVERWLCGLPILYLDQVQDNRFSNGKKECLLTRLKLPKPYWTKKRQHFKLARSSSSHMLNRDIYCN